MVRQDELEFREERYLGRGPFSFYRKWNNIDLRGNVVDGRCYIEEEDNGPIKGSYYYVNRKQTAEWISSWDFLEYPDKDSELDVALSFAIELRLPGDAKYDQIKQTFDAEYSNYIDDQNNNGGQGYDTPPALFTTDVDSVVFKVYRIDDPDFVDNGLPFVWQDWNNYTEAAPPTARTYIGYVRITNTNSQDDTGGKPAPNSPIYLRSDFTFRQDKNQPSGPTIEWEPTFNGPERQNGRMQTDTYYFATIEQAGTFQGPSYLDSLKADPPELSGAIDQFETIIVAPYDLQSYTTRKELETYKAVESVNPNYFLSSQGNERYNNDYFAWWKTPPSFDVKKKTIPSVRWNSASAVSVETADTNPNFDGDVKGIQNPSNITSFDVTLRGFFFYKDIDLDDQSLPRLPDDVAASCGFEVRKLQPTATDWAVVFERDLSNLQLTDYVRVLDSNLGDDPSRAVEFEYFFIARANEQYHYRIFVKKKDGTKYYADQENGKTTATYLGKIEPFNFRITTSDIDIRHYVPPAPDFGFWWQMYPAWYVTETSPTSITPYLTVRKIGSVGPGTDLPDNDNSYPVHRYFNYTFRAEKNYMFRTILDNYYSHKSPLSSELSDLKLITPWGEVSKLEVPYFPIDNVPDTMKRVNMYSFANINGYSYENNNRLAPSAQELRPKPNSFITSATNPKNPVTYVAKPFFGGQQGQIFDKTYQPLVSGLDHVSVFNFEWLVQGSATYNIMTQTGNGPVKLDSTQAVPFFHNNEPFGGRGWHYLANDRKFVWFDKVGPASDLASTVKELNSNLPTGGDPKNYFQDRASSPKFLVNNYIAFYVQFQKFNLLFDYENESDFGVSMYVGGELPLYGTGDGWWKTDIDELIAKGLVTFVGKLGKSSGKPQTCEFIGLVGNQYVFFVADPVLRFGENGEQSQGLFGTLTQRYEFQSIASGYPINDGTSASTGFGKYSTLSLYNFRIAGLYNDANNKVHNTIGELEAGLSVATYSIKLGSGNNVFKGSPYTTITLTGKAGNGRFRSGIWENGVWNSGWREDLTYREFNSVDNAYYYNRARTWRMTVNGHAGIASSFSVGDLVSISNIAAIDTNGARKLITKYYRILEQTDSSIVVEFDTVFPIQRIEKDSEDHRILVSKNVWLSGVFLNGYFDGIWNSGLFSGYPMITKMENAHWIDGIFNGGHFKSEKYKKPFKKAYEYVYEGSSRLAIEFETSHRIEANDQVSMSYKYSDGVERYFGTTTVLASISEFKIVTGIAYRTQYAQILEGVVNTTLSTGLIQNFRFYSNNVSVVTSLQSLLSERVFSYNSWIDVNYSNKSAVNIGRPQTFIEPASQTTFTENNLYGYPTGDVLSSESVFRDSFSLTLRRYKLGSKYQRLTDYVGAASLFEQDFGPTDTTPGDGTDSFSQQGWKGDLMPPKKYKLIAEAASKSTGETLQLDFKINKFVNTFSAGDTVKVFGPGFERFDLDGDPQTFGIGLKEIKTYEEEVQIVAVLKPSSDTTRIVTDSTRFTSPSTPGLNWDLQNVAADSGINSNYWIELTTTPSVSFSRTAEPTTTTTPLLGKELKVVAKNEGGILNLVPTDEVAGRTNGGESETIAKQRYTLIEFDLVDQVPKAGTGLYEDESVRAPLIHFNNLNYVDRQVRQTNGELVIKTVPASYLPVTKNVNHVKTVGKRKQEFFFNKRNLQMRFSGDGVIGDDQAEFYIDNLKLYETDMVPFFQYFNNSIGKIGNINVSVQIPNSGVSPDSTIVDEKVVDATTLNETVSDFVERLVGSNLTVPKLINWRADYAIYRTQNNGGSTFLESLLMANTQNSQMNTDLLESIYGTNDLTE